MIYGQYEEQWSLIYPYLNYLKYSLIQTHFWIPILVITIICNILHGQVSGYMTIFTKTLTVARINNDGADNLTNHKTAFGGPWSTFLTTKWFTYLEIQLHTDVWHENRGVWISESPLYITLQTHKGQWYPIYLLCCLCGRCSRHSKKDTVA